MYDLCKLKVESLYFLLRMWILFACSGVNDIMHGGHITMDYSKRVRRYGEGGGYPDLVSQWWFLYRVLDTGQLRKINFNLLEDKTFIFLSDLNIITLEIQIWTVHNEIMSFAFVLRRKDWMMILYLHSYYEWIIATSKKNVYYTMIILQSWKQRKEMEKSFNRENNDKCMKIARELK